MARGKPASEAEASSGGNARDGRRTSLVTEVARELENQISVGKWPVGFRIGNEEELARRLGVSRRTLREALRILEVSGLVDSRRGRSGGLFVASSYPDFICKTVANYLEFIRVSSEELGGLLKVLGKNSLIRAMANLSGDDYHAISVQISASSEKSLPERMETNGAISEMLLRKSGNAALILYMKVLRKMTFDAGVYSRLDDESWYKMLGRLSGGMASLFRAVAERRDAEAIAANDEMSGFFQQWFEDSLLYRREPVSAQITQRAYDYFPPSRPMKKADRVQRELREIIFQAGDKTGSFLGSEKELVAHFGVGRWVLREALRSLEQMGVIEVERGARGGIRVVAPDPVLIADACRRHLRREGLRRQDAVEARVMLDEHAQSASGPIPINDLFRRVLTP